MTYSALTLSMQTLPHTRAAATASQTGSDAIRGGDARSVEPAGRGDFGALHQILMSAQEIAVSADTDIAAVDLPSNPIELSRGPCCLARSTCASRRLPRLWRLRITGAASCPTPTVRAG